MRGERSAPITASSRPASADPRRIAAGCLVGVERKVMMAGRDKDGAAVFKHLWRRSPRAVGASTAESDDVRELRKFVFGKIDDADASAEVQAEKAILSPPAKHFHLKAGSVIDVVRVRKHIVRRAALLGAPDLRATPLSPAPHPSVLRACDLQDLAMAALAEVSQALHHELLPSSTAAAGPSQSGAGRPVALSGMLSHRSSTASWLPGGNRSQSASGSPHSVALRRA